MLRSLTYRPPCSVWQCQLSTLKWRLLCLSCEIGIEDPAAKSVNIAYLGSAVGVCSGLHVDAEPGLEKCGEKHVSSAIY
jgi:hypothetical protein